MCMRIRIYYMYISTGFNSTPRNPHPHEVRLSKGLLSASSKHCWSLKWAPQFGWVPWPTPLLLKGAASQLNLETTKTVPKCVEDIANRMAHEGWKPKDCFTDPGWIKGYVFVFWDALETNGKHIPQYSLHYRGKSESFSASYVFRNTFP